MLRSEAIAIIKRGLGFRQTQDAAIVAALKQAQRDLELGQTLPNWLLRFDVNFPVLANDTTVTLPDNFLRFHEDYQPYHYNSEGARVFLPRKRFDEAYNAYVASGSVNDVPATSTYPLVCVLLTKRSLRLIPTPQVPFTLFVTYYEAADVLDSDIENAWLLNAPNYLIGVAGVHVAGDLRDKGAMDKFSLMAKTANRAFMGDIIEDELAGRPLIMGRNN